MCSTLSNSAYLATYSAEDIVMQIRNGVNNNPQPQVNIPLPVEVNESKITRNSLSSLARAQEILSADNISCVTKLHCFNVKQSSGVTRVVTLFPKETWS